MFDNFAGDEGEEGEKYKFLRQNFGYFPDEAAVQDVGDIVCQEGRVVAFPNIFQYCFSPIRLADPTKPGHQKILALYLVDPEYRVISTANVPLQQREWWAEKVVSTGPLKPLPTELQQMIVEAVDEFPIGMTEAKEIRLEMLAEQRKMRKEIDTALSRDERDLEYYEDEQEAYEEWYGSDDDSYDVDEGPLDLDCLYSDTSFRGGVLESPTELTCRLFPIVIARVRADMEKA